MVTPFAGVWIEIIALGGILGNAVVTPFAGVWIEIVRCLVFLQSVRRHSLRGSVD